MDYFETDDWDDQEVVTACGRTVYGTDVLMDHEDNCRSCISILDGV